jgi:type I restriction enzyme S subunit
MKKIKLEQISKLISSGLTPLRSNLEYWNNGSIYWLKTEQLGERYICDTSEKITSYALENTSIKLNPINTLCIAMYGEGRTRGNVSILKSEMTTNQACCNLVIDENQAHHEYIYYFLKTQYNQLRNLSSGVRNNLNSNDIKKFEVRLPKDIKTQKKIVDVLSTFDDKIELNNRVNAELENLAKTIYDYWFVQFDFPDRNGKPYKSSGGEMVYNKELKRNIPKCWDVDSLWNIANYFNGLALQNYRPVNENYLRVIKIREMNEGFSDNTEFARADIPEEAIVKDGDVLFSWSATLDVQMWARGKGALNQHIFKITSKRFPKTFYYYELKNYLNHFKMMAEQRKTTMGHITQEHLKQSRIVIPPISIINNLHTKITPIFEKHLLLEKENQQLTQLRDWLLPMLMNGQISIK